MLIEQAIFTSAQSARSDGYHLVAQSLGISDQDARELSVRGPTHDSLVDDAPDVQSVNFHALPSGAFCVSRTCAAGPEYSNRGCQRIYTQCLVVPRELLARFSNNPFALLKAAIAQGDVNVHDTVPESLEPFRLLGRAGTVDHALVNKVVDSCTPLWLGTALQAVLRNESIVVGLDGRRERFMTALVSCLPPALRSSLSLTTGLRFSPRRRVRMTCIPREVAQLRRLERRTDAVILDLGERPPPAWRPVDGWPAFITALLQRGQAAALASYLGSLTGDLSIEELHTAGRDLLSSIDKGDVPDARYPRLAETPTTVSAEDWQRLTESLRVNPASDLTWRQWQKIHHELVHLGEATRVAEMVQRACRAVAESEQDSQVASNQMFNLLAYELAHNESVFEETIARLRRLPVSGGRARWLQVVRRVKDHAVHLGARGGETASHSVAAGPAQTTDSRNDGPHTAEPEPLEPPAAASGPLPPAAALALDLEPIPSLVLGDHCPDSVEQLEELDDAVFEAIAGKPDALLRLRQLWEEVTPRLTGELLEESKAQYLRHALGAWRHCLESEEVVDLQRSMALLDIVTLIVGESNA